MDAPQVNTIILNWNGYDDTAACLDSLGLLDYPRHTVIVVDNGSSDDSAARLRSAYPWITLLETGCNLGFAAGNNVGIRHALELGADFLWLLNNDTVVFPKTLTEMIRTARVQDHPCMIGSILYNMEVRPAIQAWGGGTVNTWSGRSINATKPERLDYLTAASLLVPRYVFETVGLFDDGYFLYWEDVDFSFRARATGIGLVVAKSAPVLHRGSSSLRDDKPLLDVYATASLIRFLSRHAKLPTVSIAVSLTGKIVRRLAALELKLAIAVVRGAKQGFSAMRSEAPRG